MFFINRKRKKILKKLEELHKKPMFTFLNKPSIFEIEKEYKNIVLSYCMEMNRIEEQCRLRNVCGKGCNACCRQCITINSVEGLLIQREISMMSYDNIRKIREKNSNILENMRKNGIPINYYEFCQNAYENSKKYFSMHMQCPFISDNGTCLIYEIRPIVCWQYRHYGKKSDCEERHDPNLALPVYNNEYIDNTLFSLGEKYIDKFEKKLLVDFLNKIL